MFKLSMKIQMRPRFMAMLTSLVVVVSGFSGLSSAQAHQGSPAVFSASHAAQIEVKESTEGQTQVHVVASSKFRGKSLTLMGSEGQTSLGKVKLNKSGKGVLTISAQLTPGDRLALFSGKKKILEYTVNFIEKPGGPSAASPSAPILETRLGTVTVRWDGLTASGKSPAKTLDKIEIHVSTAPGDKPTSSTLEAQIDKSGSDFHVITDLDYSTPVYVSLVFVDRKGKKSKPSASTPVAVRPLVDVDGIRKVLEGRTNSQSVFDLRSF